tara:strand:- start:212 stop:625 length:414 start_codon:yes stop_codon:yes gene_type:complete
MTIKDVASNPGSLWITLIAAAGAVLTGFSENKTAVESISSFCHQAENSSYQSLVDLREKVDWIHSRVKDNEQKLAFAMSPPGGPSQENPPSTSEEVEKPKEPEKAPDAKKEQAEPVPLKEDGSIKWEPIKRPGDKKQ